MDDYEQLHLSETLYQILFILEMSIDIFPMLSVL